MLVNTKMPFTEKIYERHVLSCQFYSIVAILIILLIPSRAAFTSSAGIPAVNTTTPPVSTHRFTFEISIASLQISSVVWHSIDLRACTPQ